MKKTKLTRSLMAACSIVALSAVMYGCVHSGDDEPAATPPATPDPMEPEVDELGDAQAAAAAAAAAAAVASTGDPADDASLGAAGSAADAAKYSAGRADIQTIASSAVPAGKAATAAAHAASAAADAKTASDAAAAATTITAAVMAQGDAEDAQEAAEAAAALAAKYATAATEAAAKEVHIDGETKSVGTTSITIDGENITKTGTDSIAREYGFLGKVQDASLETDGAPAVAAAPTNDPPVKASPTRPGIGARTIDLGVTYDSHEDNARLTLMTHYIGSNTVSAFQNSTVAAFAGTATQSSAEFDHDNDGDTDPQIVDIRLASGTFMSAGDVTVADFMDGSIDADSKAVPLYYYLRAATDDPTTLNVDDTKQFLRRGSSDTDRNTGITTYMYQPVHVVSGVSLPAGKAFAHLHYGLWNDLTAATLTSDNLIANLGIGFVTATADSGGMTSDMPTTGDATYTGDYVANVRMAHPTGEGDLVRRIDSAAITTDFAKDDIDITLMNLVTLDGTIAGNSFSGTTAVVHDTVATTPTVVDNTSGLATAGTFTGTFSGGFFGPKAAEAGGVFEFTSKDKISGEFLGSFGAAKEAEGGRD